MVEQGILEPLDSYLDTETVEALSDAILPDEWKWGKVDGVTYKLSQNVYNYHATAYNKELLDSYGIDNAVKSIIAGLLLFIFPLFTAMLDISQVDFFTRNIFVTGNQYMELEANGKTFLLCIPIILGIAARMLLPLKMEL